MTKIAIMSDLHANKNAVELVLKDMEQRGVDEIVCLGDLVTKYFYPKEVVDAVMANASIVLKGNCDHLVSTDERYKFARGKLGLSRIEYLSELPIKKQIEINKVLIGMYHSMPDSLDAMFNPQFGYNDNTRYRDNIVTDYKRMFASSDPQISLVGHTHHDYIGVEKDDSLRLIEDPVHLTNKDRAIVNVGSVGEHCKMVKQNGVYVPSIDTYLTYALLDDSGKEGELDVEIVRVPYRDTLRKVYMDMVDMQNKALAPYSPNDTKIVHDSLLNIGYSEEEIKPRSL